MKKTFMIMLLAMAVTVSLHAQEKLKIGEVKNGKLMVTEPDALKAFLMNSLGKSGTFGKDYQVSTPPEGDRFFVYYAVSGNKDKITSIGVVLVKDKNEAFIVENPAESAPGGPGAGGSATITCTGMPCNSCYPEITWPVGNWFPLIICKCNDPDGVCSMSVSFSINIQIGGF
jgi:hypothetical protein